MYAILALVGVVIIILIGRISRPVSLEGLETASALPSDESMPSFIIKDMRGTQATGTPLVTTSTQPSSTPATIFSLSATGTITTSFRAPYPLAWRENGTGFTVTEISFGPRVTSEGTDERSVIFTLSVTSPADNDTCIPIPLQRVIDELGTLQDPVTKQFVFPESGGCIPAPSKTYAEQKVPFTVTASNQYLFTTGGTSNIFFEINIAQDTLTLTKIPQGGG